ncbi:hypothetical protein ACQP1G_20165 [Nocardia sp. CA-107356]|uniref:hypothetical protein n=1 Tax=Nocardia sp. CA-107356 TaxID=3239972 RepID=UPI003D8AF2B6
MLNGAGQRAHVWVDEHTVHILIDGQLVKTTPSNLDADHIHQLRMRGVRPAGPPPAGRSIERDSTLATGTVIEVDRTVDVNGDIDLAKKRLKIGRELASTKVTLRVDGHLVHVVHNDVLAKTLSSPVPAHERTKIRGARFATTKLPPPAPGTISVQRIVPTDGVVMVARRRLRVGRTYAGQIITIHVEDIHFRVTCNGADLALRPKHHRRPCQALECQNPFPANLIHKSTMS